MILVPKNSLSFQKSCFSLIKSTITASRIAHRSMASRDFMASQSYQLFQTAIADAEKLISIFDQLPTPEVQQQNEVLKRAALIMTLTAWESYIEAYLLELVSQKISGITGSFAGNFIQRKLDIEIAKLHNPTSEKVKQLSQEFLASDLTEKWRWANVEPVDARRQLNQWLTKRGDAVHNACASDDPKKPHLVKRDDLDKAVRFFKELVRVTDGAV